MCNKLESPLSSVARGKNGDVRQPYCELHIKFCDALSLCIYYVGWNILLGITPSLVVKNLSTYEDGATFSLSSYGGVCVEYFNSTTERFNSKSLNTTPWLASPGCSNAGLH